jgi:predicted aconitase
MQLTEKDQEMLSGALGEGVQLAMRLLTNVARSYDAEQLIDIKWAHVASAYHHSQANLDFAQRLANSQTKVAVPTTLTACSLNMRESLPDGTDAAVAMQLIELYKAMGCRAVMTCAPYHTRAEPGIGEDIAWCESSAVVYANSVLGARTNRYVEFLDMCAAVTGRVPDCGLHKTENRRATILITLQSVPDAWLQQEWFYHALGITLGRQVGSAVAAIDGLPVDIDSEFLRALGAAAATSGSLSMFHAIGITPEAATREHAFQNIEPESVLVISASDIQGAANKLSRNGGEKLTAVCLGAPHFSRREFDRLIKLLDGRCVSATVSLHVATSEAVLVGLERAGLLATLSAAGVNIITGRCTYYRPTIDGCDGHVMTNSAKWAYYAPTGLGASVTFASMAACVESACAGRAVDVSKS